MSVKDALDILKKAYAEASKQAKDFLTGLNLDIDKVIKDYKISDKEIFSWAIKGEYMYLLYMSKLKIKPDYSNLKEIAEQDGNTKDIEKWNSIAIAKTKCGRVFSNYDKMFAAFQTYRKK